MKLRKIARELRRGAGLARVGGPGAAWTFVREEVLHNAWLRASAHLPRRASSGVECNVCGWRGARFLTHCAARYVDRDSFCPACASYPRHRGFAWLWKEHLAAELAPLRHGAGRKLMFAPERGMLSLLEPALGAIEGVDLDASNPLVHHREDLQALTFADGSVDFVSCFHVLEHVPDDRLALRELHRVLSPTGRLILCVPITFGRRETIDYGGPHPLLNGHCYDYGDDFEERLVDAGFAGRSWRTDLAVPEALHARHGLSKQEEIFVLHRAAAGAAHVERGRAD